MDWSINDYQHPLIKDRLHHIHGKNLADVISEFPDILSAEYYRLICIHKFDANLLHQILTMYNQGIYNVYNIHFYLCAHQYLKFGLSSIILLQNHGLLDNDKILCKIFYTGLDIESLEYIVGSIDNKIIIREISCNYHKYNTLQHIEFFGNYLNDVLCEFLSHNLIYYWWVNVDKIKLLISYIPVNEYVLYTSKKYEFGCYDKFIKYIERIGLDNYMESIEINGMGLVSCRKMYDKILSLKNVFEMIDDEYSVHIVFDLLMSYAK